MIRKTMMALLVALVASFALSAPADAAPKKTVRTRAKHSSRVTSGAAETKPAAKKTVVRKRPAAKTRATTTAKKPAAKNPAVKRKPTTKPR
jgi:hypothetical protein